MSPALLHAPPPLRLPLPVDENLGGAKLLQELLLHVLRLNPGFLLLPARHRAANMAQRQAHIQHEIVLIRSVLRAPTLNWTVTVSLDLVLGTSLRRCG